MNKIFFYLTFLFVIGSFGGWLIELIFRKLAHKKWINPGFLSGPYLPIYGLGLIILYLIAIIDLPIESVFLVTMIKIFSVGFAMTLVEYVAGIVFIKTMGIKLWDYSKRWGNVNGVICPLFSVIWSIVGAIYLLYFHNIVLILIGNLSNSIYYPFFIGIFFGFILWDLFSTLEISSIFKKFSKDSKVVLGYEAFKLKERNYYTENKIKYNFLKPLRMDKNITNDLLIKYLEEVGR